MNARRSRFAVGLLVALCLVGCARAWDAANRTGLAQDTRELLARGSIEVEGLDCEMVGQTRTGTCRLDLTPEQIASIAAALELARVETAADEDAIEAWELEGGCRQQDALLASTAPMVFRSEVRPDSLRLDGGTAFEYMLLYAETSTGLACIQLSYTYG